MAKPPIGTLIPIGAVGDAEESHVLEGKTFSSELAGVEAIGTMPNRGAYVITPSSVEQVIPAGYHNGNGTVTAVSLDINQTSNRWNSSSTGTINVTFPSEKTGIVFGVAFRTGSKVNVSLLIGGVQVASSSGHNGLGVVSGQRSNMSGTVNIQVNAAATGVAVGGCAVWSN